MKFRKFVEYFDPGTSTHGHAIAAPLYLGGAFWASLAKTGVDYHVNPAIPIMYGVEGLGIIALGYFMGRKCSRENISKSSSSSGQWHAE